MTEADRLRQGGHAAPARQQQPAPRSAGASLLRLQRGAGNSAVSRLVAGRLLQRTPDFEQELVIGSDISVEFATKAKQIASGKIDDAALLVLHDKALEDDQSVGDAERMLMASLLVPANAKTVADARMTRGAKLKLRFARTPDTTASMRRIADLGRHMGSPQVAAALIHVLAAHATFDQALISQAGTELETAANAQILELGKGDGRIKDVLAFADAQPSHPSRADILAAMLAASSDSTRGDMVLAAAVYVIAKAEGHPLADDIRAGQLKVDEVEKVPAPPGVTGVVAAYVTRGEAHREKGDTLYLSTKFRMTNLADRALVIHELEHAKGDKSPPATAPLAIDEEMKAFVAQGAYMVKTIDALPAGKARNKAVQDIATVWGGGWLEGAVLASRADPKTRGRLEDVIREINRASRDKDKFTPELLNRILADPDFESTARDAITAVEQLQPGETKLYDRLSGESRLDWMGP